MKQLNQFGHVQILASYATGRRRKFDKWPQHATGEYAEILLAVGDSGYYYVGSEFLLKSGKGFAYLTDTKYKLDEPKVLYDAVVNYQVPGYPGTWTGEGFNHILRNSAAMKIDPSTDLEEWMRTH